MSDLANPYISKVKEFPHLILPFERDEFTPAEADLLSTRIAEFRSVVCEIGSGSGCHLIELAKREPDTLFVGFEIRFKRIYSCASQAERTGIKNIMLLRTFGQDLCEFFKPGSLAGLYINFPDPWDKRRWLKHRLITAEFLGKLSSTLKPKGFFSFKTDHPGYFDSVCQLIEANKSFTILRQTRDLHKSEFNLGNVLTEFEKLFISKGLPANYLLAIKIGE